MSSFHLIQEISVDHTSDVLLPAETTTAAERHHYMVTRQEILVWFIAFLVRVPRMQMRVKAVHTAVRTEITRSRLRDRLSHRHLHMQDIGCSICQQIYTFYSDAHKVGKCSFS